MEFYVDGSCKGNGKKLNSGGFGVVIVEDGQVIDTISQQVENTTNNRMELSAILGVFFKYGQKAPLPPPIVYSDSSYSINTLTDWMFKWAENGWVKSDGKTPENLDLIQAYYNFYSKGYRIDLRKVKGHSGIKFNELADKLAKGEYCDDNESKMENVEVLNGNTK